jgi:hypothetical protein
VLLLKPGQRGGNRTEEFHILLICPIFRLQCPADLSKVLSVMSGLLLVLSYNENLYQARERRVLQCLSKADFLIVKGPIILVLCSEDAKVVRVEGLEDDAAGSHASAGAPGHLSQELESPLPGPEVGKIE